MNIKFKVYLLSIGALLIFIGCTTHKTLPHKEINAQTEISMSSQTELPQKQKTIKDAAALEVGSKEIARLEALVPKEKRKSSEELCKNLNQKFKSFNWQKIICNPKTWKTEAPFYSVDGNPLFYQVFDQGTPKTTTLVMCAVHGDELPSSYLCFHMTRDLLFDNPEAYKDIRVVVAPIVNPDAFLKSSPTRTNARGIDLNRNFPTKDFEEKAISQWKTQIKSSPRKFPGKVAGSEPETLFQMMLIERFRPDKIISIHSPYGWLDVDSPSKPSAYGDDPDGFDFSEFLQKSKDMASEMSKKSRNYRVKNFRIFPGSLGNYAAFERGIPTYTLELPTSKASEAQTYWVWMKRALTTGVLYDLSLPKRVDKTNIGLLQESAKLPASKEKRIPN